MFHRFGGAVFIYVIGVLFFLLSFQNTWAFLNKSLPGADPAFLWCMMIIFEGGLFGWLSLLVAGAQNVPRVIISSVMLLICIVAVGTAAYYMLGSMLHQGIGYRLDPRIVAYVGPTTILSYLATGLALILWVISNPKFHARIRHINATGHAPGNVQQVKPGVYVSEDANKQIGRAQSTRQIAPPAQGQPRTYRSKIAQKLARLASAWRDGEDDSVSADVDADSEEPHDDTLSQPTAEQPAEDQAQEMSMSYSRTPAGRVVSARRKPSRSKFRTLEQSRPVLTALSKDNPNAGNEELAQMAGCTTKTVQRWRNGY